MAVNKVEKQTKVSVQDSLNKQLLSQFYDIIKKAEVSEKATRMIEFENKLVFEVIRKANKPLVKLLVEKKFNKKVKSVNMLNSINGTKRAIVTFKDEGVASDLASELGLI